MREALAKRGPLREALVKRGMLREALAVRRTPLLVQPGGRGRLW